MVSVDSCAVASSDSATAAAEYMNFFMKIGLLKPRQGAITCCYTNIAFVPWQHYLPRFYGYVLSP